MPRRRRERTAGLVFHVINRAAKRAVLFHDNADYAAFVTLLTDALGRSDVALFAYCIMPNHWHFLLTPKSDGAMSRFMHWLTMTHARRWQDAHGVPGLGAVYQGRFKAIAVREDDHFLRVCRYVERNPLRASLVERAEDWRWSSLHTAGSSWLAPWPVARPCRWLAHVNATQTSAELEHLRRAIKNGVPFGDADWAENLARTQGASPRRSRGRPRRIKSASVL